MPAFLALYRADKEAKGFMRAQAGCVQDGKALVVARILAAFVMAAVLGRLQGAREDRTRYVATVEVLEREIDAADIDQVQRVFRSQGGLLIGSSLHHIHLPCPALPVRDGLSGLR